MISSEVQRTLVKSPPELWAELSDPSALARHLGELGDIRITHLEPETAVEWQAENASGTVLLKPSGWGTKVTLTANRELPEPEPVPQAGLEHVSHVEPQPVQESEPEPAAESEQEPALETEPHPKLDNQPSSAAEPEPEPTVEAEHEDQPEVPLEAAADSEPAPERESRRGFFARLFRRGAGERPLDPAPHELTSNIRSPAVLPEVAASVEYLSEPPWAVATPQSLPEPLHSLEQQLEAYEQTEHTDSEDAQALDISAELKATEEATAEQVTAMLTGVLDRLGAAHHRPFSRS